MTGASAPTGSTVPLRDTASPRVAEGSQHPVVLALGSNLGDRMANLRLGIGVLDGDGITATAVSGIFETAPVGGPDQDNYLNAVLLAVSVLSARQVLARCAAAESAAGRVRTVRWGPRTLDVDIIAYDDVTCAEPDLTLPHPRAHERAFVLAPWLDVDLAAVLPGRGRVADLLDAASMAGVSRRPELQLTLPARGGFRGVVPPGGSSRGSGPTGSGVAPGGHGVPPGCSGDAGVASCT